MSEALTVQKDVAMDAVLNDPTPTAMTYESLGRWTHLEVQYCDIVFLAFIISIYLIYRVHNCIAWHMENGICNRILFQILITLCIHT